MASVIQNLMENIIGEGARSTKFECAINFVSSDLFKRQQDIFAHVKTSSFPGKSHEVIDFKFKGRSTPIKGQTKYENTWSCSFYLTEDHSLKKAFDDWIESLDQKHNIKDVNEEVKKAQKENYNRYYSVMTIAQLDFHGSHTSSIYTLYNVFPKSISAVEVDYSAVGTILEYTVEFAYSYYDIKNMSTDKGTFVDELAGKAQGELDKLVKSAKDSLANTAGKLSTSVTSSLPSVTIPSNVRDYFGAAAKEVKMLDRFYP